VAQVIDVKSGSVNDLITPNRNLRILGSKLKTALILILTLTF